MNFRIADTFTNSLTKLTNDEQKQVKTTAFDLQLNPANPGMQFHKVDRAKDKQFWSVRVSRDIRIIVHKTYTNLMLCYVGHHDEAYQWAERRKIEVHPKTGAAQLVEIRERVEEVVVRQAVYEDVTAPKPRLFSKVAEATLLNYGVPEEWLPDVLQADEDSILELAVRLPAEAGEALLELATGGTPQPSVALAASVDPFSHPDAMRRFRVMEDVEELERALAAPWDKWAVFLHPSQRELVERDYTGPARVSGSAGTGKTVVAIHRAVYLASNHPQSRVLLTTFSRPLANNLFTLLRSLIHNQPRLGEQIEVHAVQDIAERLYEYHVGKPVFAGNEQIASLLSDAAAQVKDHGFSQRFLEVEWREVVDARQIQIWEEYRNVIRLGRKKRVPESRREKLWEIFEIVRNKLQEANLITQAEMFARLAGLFGEKRPPFDFIVVDEAQDVSVMQLQFLAALGSDKNNGLFFAGDLGQRIFQMPFSWKSQGVDVQGRSQTLHINYRSSHQIRAQADRLLDAEIADVDGIVESRKGTISVFNGPAPTVKEFANKAEEIAGVAHWLQEIISGDDIQPHELGVFVRSNNELDRARKAVEKTGLKPNMLDENVEIKQDCLSIGTMHLAKGLEFKIVVVMACDDEVLPLQERIESVSDDSDLLEAYNTERHLFYVACTRAREGLFISGVSPVSEFLEDLMG